MMETNSVIREDIKQLIAIFFISLLFIMSAKVEGNFWKFISSSHLAGQDYFKVDLIESLILASLVTVLFFVIKIIYKKITQLNSGD